MRSPGRVNSQSSIRNPQSISRAALAILSGLLLAASYPPFDWWWLAWVALAPLLLAVRGLPPRRAFGIGYLSGLVAFATILSWLRVFGPAPWLLLAGYLALYPALFGVLTGVLHPHRPARWIWLVAFAWTGLEYVRSLGVFGFPWALLGLTQHAVPPVIQAARVAGVYGVSFLVALGGAAAAALVAGRRVAPVVLPLIAIAGAAVWGSAQGRPVPAPGIPVAVLQPVVPLAEKFDPAYAGRHLDALGQLAAQAGATGAELIVFPETALPGNIFGPSGTLPVAGRWAREARATIITSSLEDGVANIAVAVAPSGMAVSRYDKVRLVAFGEAGVHPGARHDPLWTPLGRVGVAICFESIFPAATRTLAARGAELLVIMTNDAWFDGTPGPAQHAAHAALRAVETGRWVVRAANTGVSMIVDPAGNVRAVAPVAAPAALAARVSLERASTPYARWGDLPVWIGMMLVVAAAAPQIRQAARPYLRHPAFGQAVAAAALPWITVLVLLKTRAPWWTWVAALVVFVALLAAARPYAWRPAHPWKPAAAAAAGVAVIAALCAIMVLAYRSAGVPVGFTVPAGGWLPVALRQVLIAAAVEGWLRGAAFAALAAWGGPTAAVLVTTALGVTLQIGLPPEAYVWALVSGSAFGLIRARGGSALAFVIPHALGNLFLAGVAPVR